MAPACSEHPFLSTCTLQRTCLLGCNSHPTLPALCLLSQIFCRCKKNISLLNRELRHLRLQAEGPQSGRDDKLEAKPCQSIEQHTPVLPPNLTWYHLVKLGTVPFARMPAPPPSLPQPPNNTLSAADQRVRGKRASAKCSASTQPWPPLYKHGPWDTGRGIKRSVSAAGLCIQTRHLKGLMFMLCLQGGHQGSEWVVEGWTCSSPPLSRAASRVVGLGTVE